MQQAVVVGCVLQFSGDTSKLKVATFPVCSCIRMSGEVLLIKRAPAGLFVYLQLCQGLLTQGDGPGLRPLLTSGSWSQGDGPGLRVMVLTSG